MTMSVAEFGQLKKLLTLGTSANDHEALAAWRAATALVAKCGFTWEMVLSRTVTVITEAVECVDADEGLDDAFRRALDRTPRGGFRDTLLSIQAQYQRRGTVSDAQRAVVMRAADG